MRGGSPVYVRVCGGRRVNEVIWENSAAGKGLCRAYREGIEKKEKRRIID